MLHWSRSGELMIMVILEAAPRCSGPAIGAVLLIGLETPLTGWTEHSELRSGANPCVDRLVHQGWVLSSFLNRKTPMA